jgi:hypothetical protein
MTVCIAATSESAGRIVFVSDIMLSNEDSKVEGARKIDLLTPPGAPPWVAAFANDPTHFQPMMEHARAYIEARPPSTVDDVMLAIQSAHDARLKEEIERSVLLPYGIKREQFVRSGLKWFGEKQFKKLHTRIARVRVSIDLVVAGFDAAGRQRMFELCNGKTSRIDHLNYHAIGAGARWVEATLDPISWFTGDIHMDGIIYRLLKAKFVSEYAPSVGRATVAVVVSSDGRLRFLPDKLIELARKTWDEELRKFPPLEITEPLKKWFFGKSDIDYFS